MTATTIHDLAEWRSRLAYALRVAFQADDAGLPAARIAALQERVRALEHEGRRRGFLPVDGARG
ncbi:hypothetical protein [Muricoccus nepalensis]|uniref:hypothetical protein n=1 Tax=Muricoccus nepalensis TaxID=1854500 RepID=UPI00112E1D6F|nr:hypothetical protein [Roseomonas nepalensis]